MRGDATRFGPYGPPEFRQSLKTAPQRNPALLAMANGKPCLLQAPIDKCEGTRGWTTVACHSNWSIHGKAMRRKADDQWTVWGCGPCHLWLDFGPAPAEEKQRVFLDGHARQLIAWQRIVDLDEDQREADAAFWALVHFP